MFGYTLGDSRAIALPFREVRNHMVWAMITVQRVDVATDLTPSI
jgi:hypothetical protein